MFSSFHKKLIFITIAMTLVYFTLFLSNVEAKYSCWFATCLFGCPGSGFSYEGCCCWGEPQCGGFPPQCWYRYAQCGAPLCDNYCSGNIWYHDGTDACTSSGWNCQYDTTTCYPSGCSDATCSATSGCGLQPNDANCPASKVVEEVGYGFKCFWGGHCTVAYGCQFSDYVFCKCSGCSGYCTSGTACYYNDACTATGETYSSCSICSGKKTADCTSSGCQNYRCIKGSCGATCASNADCDDGDPCTTDTCESDCTCTHTPKPDGTSCGVCKVCQAGNCVNRPDGYNDCGPGCQRCVSGTCQDYNPACSGTVSSCYCSGDTCRSCPSLGCCDVTCLAYTCGLSPNSANCPQTTSYCDYTNRKYCTRDAFGDCNSICQCVYDSWSCGLVDGVDYCSNCPGHCGDGVYNCGEQCEPPNTNPPSCINSDGWYCSGSVREQRDYKCGSNCLCTYSVTSSEDCATKASTDSDGGDVPGTAGYCRDYITCSAGACTYSDYYDSCVSSTQLREYYASGASCLIHDYYCSDFEVLASGDTADDPTTTGTCFGGYAAGCSANAFWRTAQPSISEGCINSADCFSNGGPGDANCLFREAYAVDSTDPCPGKDACTSTTYDPDTNSNTCNSCVGANRWNIGGDIPNCCGDDANEYRKTRVCEPGSCSSNSADDACCNSNTKCVWNSVCYSSGSTHPTNDCWYCDSGTWRNRLCGYACTLGGNSGICDGSGNCYTDAGAQTACSGVLDCSIPIPPPGYTRDLTGSCNRPSGTHKRSGTGVCDLASCVQTPSYTDPIQGGWNSIEYPSLTYTYKITDIVQVKVKGVWATAGFAPLLECRLNKTDENGNPAGGVELDAWVSGPFPKDVTFSYTVKPTDPSGDWNIDYCVLVTDFYINKGWTLKSDGKSKFCVSTKLVAG